MRNEEKIKKITEMMATLFEINARYNSPNGGWHYDYDRVIELLGQTHDIIEDSLRCPRPANLPADMPWRERPFNGDEDFDPYMYDGSMSEDDYNRMRVLMSEASDLEP